MKTLYTAHVTARGGRNGEVKSHDGVLNLETRTPKEMGGDGGFFTNPEQLFAAGYSSCFDGALNLVAKQSNVELKDTSITAHVSFNLAGGSDFSLSVKLDVEIPGIDEKTALELIDKAHHTCPYSKAIDGNVPVETNLIRNA
ncbi:MAG: organic hydroperoxide resistance protein [Candidatus Neomarinimicrobiota bacterium]